MPTVDTPTRFGEVISARRKALGMERSELARRAGVGRRFMSELENGKESVHLGLVLAVCRELSITLSADPVPRIESP